MFKILSSRHAYQRDAYFADPSVMLVSCLESSEEEIRRFAVNTILKMRAKPQKPPNSKLLKGIIKCVNPLLQWDAPSWDNMIQVFQERAPESLGTMQLKCYRLGPHYGGGAIFDGEWMGGLSIF